MKKVFLTSLLSVFVMLTMMTTEASAYKTYNGNNLTYGVGNYGNSTQYYWIDSSASDYATEINTAMSEWKYTTSYWGITTPIWYNKTTVKTSSRMDIYQVTGNSSNWAGKTDHYIGSSIVLPTTTDWVWGKIRLDSDFYAYSSSKRKAVVAHEMGHVMGLAENNLGSSSIMRVDILDYSVSIYRAQPDDLSGINYLY